MIGRAGWLLMLAVWAPAALAQTPVTIEPINPKAGHVERWNWFARAVYALHVRLISTRDVRKVERVGGYAHQPNFYREIEYVDRKSGLLISRVQWETAHPDRLHSIEVYIHDANGRVQRDYGAWYLTHSRTAPQATVINLYDYPEGLRALRQFDATDNRLFEMCEGTYRGQPVNIELWELEILRLAGELDTVMTSPAYKACFAGLPAKGAGRYLTPQ